MMHEEPVSHAAHGSSGRHGAHRGEPLLDMLERLAKATGSAYRATMSPVSLPASIRYTLTPVCASSKKYCHSSGSGPRYAGSSDGW